MYWKGKMPGINILLISGTNLSYYKDYSPLGLYKIHSRACNSAISQWQNLLMCFRNPYLPILKTSLRAACSNRANLGKTSEVPSSSFSPWVWGVWEQLPLRGFSCHLLLCFGSSGVESRAGAGWSRALGMPWHTWATAAPPCTGRAREGSLQQHQGQQTSPEVFC